MTIRSNLADNLRRLCSTRSSINAVCRDIGINRQQFERYLTQQATPGPRTLKRICAYFQIEEHELFGDGIEIGSGAPGQQKISGSVFSAKCNEVLEPLLKNAPAAIKPGIYFQWMTIPRMRSRILCTVVVVRRDGEALTFRRLTGTGEARHERLSRYRGDHRGVVTERIGQYFFLAVNKSGSLEPSFIKLQWVPLNGFILSGYGTIFTPAGASIVTVVMEAAPEGMTLRQACRKSKLFQVTDPEVDKTILGVIDDQCRSTVQQLIDDYELPT